MRSSGPLPRQCLDGPHTGSRHTSPPPHQPTTIPITFVSPPPLFPLHCSTTPATLMLKPESGKDSPTRVLSISGPPVLHARRSDQAVPGPRAAPARLFFFNLADLCTQPANLPGTASRTHNGYAPVQHSHSSVRHSPLPTLHSHGRKQYSHPRAFCPVSKHLRASPLRVLHPPRRMRHSTWRRNCPRSKQMPVIASVHSWLNH